MTCVKCEEYPVHALQIREGDPTRDPDKPGVPDKSTLRVIKLCDEHWKEVRELLSL